MPASALLAAALVLDRAQCLEPALRDSLVILQARDSDLIAVIAPPLGGQLVSLQLKSGSERRELLYRGLDFCRRPGWDGKAPVLWPATGRNYLPTGDGATPEQGWVWRAGSETTSLPMPIHGFARYKAWHLVGRRQTAAATVELADDAQTRQSYPYAFRFRLTYRLQRNRLVLLHSIRAGCNRESMPFSIGNHITFVLPLAGSGDASAAAISTAPSARYVLDVLGRPERQEPQAPLVAVPVATLGRENALPLAGYPTRATAILSQPDGIAIRIDQSASQRPDVDPVRFNLWGNVDERFFSVEPWLGLQNSLASGRGLVRLAPLRDFRWRISLDVAARPRATIRALYRE